MILITKRIARGEILNTDNRGDVARVTGLDILALISLDLDQSRNTLALVRARIVDRVAFAQRAGINPEENELADERIAPKFKRERAEVATIIRRRLHRLRRGPPPSLGGGEMPA